ncbi:cytochrome b/b6 domain-containing protein [Glutamicibacter sp. NPDC087344]|uniref:cytochrome b/b6 domain-containing protein n=1 Tax=Glutamicibacter sp. NPDC087344 TaxID=3363994 RepID=UPI00380C1E9F
MSTPTRTPRQGLPRTPGGEPWPPADYLAAVPQDLPVVAGALEADPVVASTPLAEPAPAQVVEVPVPGAMPSVPARPLAVSATAGTVRRGLPRVPGGEPWPPADNPGVPVPAPGAASSPEPDTQAPLASVASAEPVDDVAIPPAPVESSSASTPAGDLRRGLPRIPGGQPWPPAAKAPAPAPAPAPMEAAQPVPAVVEPVAHAVAEPEVKAAPVAAPVAPAQLAAALSAPAASTAPKPETAPVAPRQSSPRPQPGTPPAPASGSTSATTKPEAQRHGPLTTKQWVLAGVLGAFCALGMATTVVLLARWILGFEAVSNFVVRYPGEYHLPEAAPIGFPRWLAWNHFFNFFLMVLIIRSGLQVRHQRKPPAYWSSKRSPKVSINLWLHQSLDVLWLVNGLVFVVVLFASGHWVRIVPTSWEVFPNAISAALQYMSLDWPTDNGWVNYNSLQQLAYFTTVFIAAPLAALTGFRLSAFWPKNAPALTKRYPIEVARALHFPTMLYFAVFIVVHVALVFSTGALRNLNHMFAAQGSTDPAQFANNWTGLWMFAVAIFVTAAAWAACRPLFLTSIARIFGKVSAR